MSGQQHTHHSISIFEKGGRRRLFDLSGVTYVSWARELDETSQAEVRLAPPPPDCLTDLAMLRPMRHELVVHMDGKRVWEGPITLVHDNPGEFKISAKDITYYLNRMIMKEDHNSRSESGEGESVVDRVMRIITVEAERFEREPLPINVTPYLQAITRPTDPRTVRKTVAGEKYVYEELDDLAWRNGIDFGVVGRRLYVADVDTPIGETRRLTSADFTSEVEIVMYGAELATETGVTDRQGRLFTHGPGNSPYYGRVELLHGNYAEGDDPEEAAAVPDEEMRSQAIRDFAGRYPLPMVVRVPENATMTHETFLELHPLLMPGVRIPITAVGTVHQVSRMMKLKRLRVTESEQGGLVSQVTLSPATTQELDIEEPA